MDKLKIWLIAGAIAVIGVFLAIFKIRSNKLKAAEYKLQSLKTDNEIKKVKEEISFLDDKIKQGDSDYSKVKSYYESKLDELTSRKEGINEAYNRLISNINPTS